MLRKKFRISLAISSVLLASGGWGCASIPGPRVTSCVSTGQNFACFDERTGQSYTLPLASSAHFVCFQPDDLQAVLNYCKSK